MLKWTAIALLAVLTSAALPAADQPPETTPETPLKNATGAGHYYGGGGGRREEYGRGSYDRSHHHGNDYKRDGYGGGDYKRDRSYGGRDSDKKDKDYGKKDSYGGSYEKKDNEYGYEEKNYDTHYCSVHASFALSFSEYKKYDKDNYGSEKSGYGSDKSSYGSEDKSYSGGYGTDKGHGYGRGYGSGYGEKGHGYGGGKHQYQSDYKVKRYSSRQFCRYAAAVSHRACQACCKIAARSSNTSPDDIVAAIFQFDPVHPTSNGAGFSYSGKDYGYDSKKGYGGEEYGDGYDRESYGGNHKGGYGGDYKRKKRSTEYGSKDYEKKDNDYGKDNSSYEKKDNDYGKDEGYGGGDDSYYSKGRVLNQCVCCAPKHY